MARVSNNKERKEMVGDQKVCTVEGCEKELRARGYCSTHWARWRKYGTPELPEKRNMPTGEHHKNWTGSNATYAAVHQRIKNTCGSASKYKCVDCGNIARQWSYDRNDPNERLDFIYSKNPIPYSVDLKKYSPRCVSCHKKFDLGAINEQANK